MLYSTIRNVVILAFASSAIALPLDTDKRDPNIGIGISFKYPFKAAEGAEGAEGTQVEKRGKDAVEFRYPIFKASEGAAEKRDPKGPYTDAIAAANAREILG
ncbi:hypothetical protein NUW58_g8324 [Xylaria curta]|uniref:Uncharacterized protein n=1 Tax=Xylaria curta TaxID=42375 RepID=A0ACC1N8F6_9PEZI|nr:hypothetical protein NUW58_g8324 [Xylaria curta]